MNCKSDVQKLFGRHSFYIASKTSIIIPVNRYNKVVPCLKSAGYNIIEVNDYAD